MPAKETMITSASYAGIPTLILIHFSTLAIPLWADVNICHIMYIWFQLFHGSACLMLVDTSFFFWIYVHKCSSFVRLRVAFFFSTILVSKMKTEEAQTKHSIQNETVSSLYLGNKVPPACIWHFNFYILIWTFCQVYYHDWLLAYLSKCDLLRTNSSPNFTMIELTILAHTDFFLNYNGCYCQFSF